jgi:hypothetical protein
MYTAPACILPSGSSPKAPMHASSPSIATDPPNSSFSCPTLLCGSSSSTCTHGGCAPAWR